MKFWKYFKVKLRLQSWKWSFHDFFNNLAKTKISLRTSASLVKVIKPIWSIKSDRVNLVAPAIPFHIVRYGTNWDRKGWPGSEIQLYYGCSSQVDPRLFGGNLFHHLRFPSNKLSFFLLFVRKIIFTLKKLSSVSKTERSHIIIGLAWDMWISSLS